MPFLQGLNVLDDCVQLCLKHPSNKNNGQSIEKIPKISPGAFIFKGPFEGLGGANLQRETCVSKSIGLVLLLEVFALFYFVF